MNDNLKKLIIDLEQKETLDIHFKSVFALVQRGLVRVNGFSKGKKGHLNCTIRQLSLFKEGDSATGLKAQAGAPSFFVENNVLKL